jgi:hypothetical protein
MNILLKVSIMPLLGSLALASALGASASRPEVTAAIQAIEQAPDPSAAVAAYANGMAVDRNDPNLAQAYVARMVDLGLPELAYHQAQALTSRESNNGLAWGVVAYVNARRGQMPDAISAINLAGQFAPDNSFVQRTAGELLAWYDAKADKSKLPQNEKDGLTRVRSLMINRPAYLAAYDTAKKAYQSQASAAAPGSAAAPSPIPDGQPQSAEEAPADQVAPLGYPAPNAAAPPPVYVYPDNYGYSGDYGYYADWGPGWVQPYPWWWWQPAGFWAGFGFFPFGGVVVFDNDDFHHHHHDHDFHHHGDEHFAHHQDGFAHHQDGHSFHGNNPAVWHHDASGHTSFFGQPAAPTGSMGQWSRANFHNTPASLGRLGGAPGRMTTTGSAMGSSATFGSGRPAVNSQSLGQAHGSSRSSWSTAPSFRSPSGVGAGSRPGAAAPAFHSWAGTPAGGRSPSAAPRNSWSGHSFQSAPAFTAPHMGAPMGGAGVPGGAIHGGAMGGGAAHGGGGFSGGGHGGGGGGGHR